MLARELLHEEKYEQRGIFDLGSRNGSNDLGQFCNRCQEDKADESLGQAKSLSQHVAKNGEVGACHPDQCRCREKQGNDCRYRKGRAVKLSKYPS